MNRSHKARRGVLSLAAGVGIAVLAGGAGAQTPPPSNNTSPVDEDVQPEIVVTGSRIRKDEFTSSSPVQIITSERSVLEGLSSAADVLQQSSVASGSGQINSTFSGFVVDGGPGVQTLSIRGLGAQRTLILLNGRRLPPAGVGGTVGPVDLNIIPNSIVDRFEILKDGASSIYGSDAVAGVANVITRRRSEGGSVEGFMSGVKGGGDEYRIDGRYGWVGDRGGLSISAEYYRREPLNLGDRDFLSCGAEYLFAARAGAVGGSGLYGLANRQVQIGDRTDAIDPRTGNFKCWGDGNLAGFVQILDPASGAGLANVTNIAPVMGLNFNPAANNFPLPGWRFASVLELNADDPRLLEQSLIPSTQTKTVFVQGDWRPEALGGAELYTELLANRRESEQTNYRTFFPDVSNFSPINPFGDPDPDFGLLSVPILILPFDGEQTVDVWRALAGIRGDISAGFLDGWRYDVYASHSRNDADYSRIIIPENNVIAGTGTLQDGSFGYTGSVCGPMAPAGCVPLNSLFSVDGLQRSQFTPQELAFLLAKDVGNTKYNQSIVEAQFTGDVFDLPAGKFAAAVGATYRRDSIDDEPGEFARTGNSWGALIAGRTRGNDTVKEAYVELEIPLLRARTGFRDFTLNLSGRYSDYDSVGDATTYKAGLNWRITDTFRLRSTYGTSFRAPALYELFLADQVSFLNQSQVDPCLRWGDPERNVPEAIRANCARDGVPPNYTAAGTSSAVIQTGGGAGRLEPEDSQALSVGLVVTPPGWGLNIALDYFDIKVENQVGSFASGVVGACYADPRFRTVPGFCDLFTRDLNPMSPNFLEITNIDASYRNIPDQRTKGFDLNVTYERNFGFGKLEVDAEATYTTDDTQELFAGRVLDFNGLVSEPELTGDIQTRLVRGLWTFTWTWNYIGDGENLGYEGEDGLETFSYSGPSTIITGVDDFITHDLSVRYRADSFEVTAGVTNVTDEEPPIVSDSGAIGGILRVGDVPLSSQYLAGYEGRGFFLVLSRRF